MKELWRPQVLMAIKYALYDSLHLRTDYSAADTIPRAQFPTPCALLERYLQFFFFFAVFAELV